MRANGRGQRSEVRGQKLRILLALIVLSFLLLLGALSSEAADSKAWLSELNEIDKRVNAYAPDKGCPDDPFILVTVQEAITAMREGNGGIGACLVQEATGEIVERGHNRQYEPYFRSDLHAEMDLLTRYEERVKARRGSAAGTPSVEQRKIVGLVLYTSLEPCPMCLSRIINMGIKKVYWAATDSEGGMGHKLRDLPPFWRDRASCQIFEPARCSAELNLLADRLFRHSMARRKAK
jgi:tRNA(adenine34) deaminase